MSNTSGHASTYIRELTMADVVPMLEMRTRNREFLQPFEPIRPDSFFTLQGQRLAIAKGIADRELDAAYIFGIFLPEPGEANEKLIGRVALTNVVRGPAQSADIGYFIDARWQGRGYMTASVKEALSFAFQKAGLHRVQAGIMPRNAASIQVAEKAGFRCEGLAKHYLHINGAWEDHRIYAITAEEWHE